MNKQKARKKLLSPKAGALSVLSYSPMPYSLKYRLILSFLFGLGQCWFCDRCDLVCWVYLFSAFH